MRTEGSTNLCFDFLQVSSDLLKPSDSIQCQEMAILTQPHTEAIPLSLLTIFLISFNPPSSASRSTFSFSNFSTLAIKIKMSDKRTSEKAKYLSKLPFFSEIWLRNSLNIRSPGIANSCRNRQIMSNTKGRIRSPLILHQRSLMLLNYRRWWKEERERRLPQRLFLQLGSSQRSTELFSLQTAHIVGRFTFTRMLWIFWTTVKAKIEFNRLLTILLCWWVRRSFLHNVGVSKRIDRGGGAQLYLPNPCKRCPHVSRVA